MTKEEQLKMISNYQKRKVAFEEASFEFECAKQALSNATFDHSDDCTCVLCYFYKG